MGSLIAFPEIYKAGMEDFVIPSYETAPNTVIQNRAKVTRSLKAIAGVERIMVKSLNLLPNEYGPNGERVWEADNKDSRIRFIGSNWINASGTSGSYANPTSSIGESLEVTFYGTALNVLGGNSGGSYDYRASIDGGAEGSNLYVTNTSAILTGRNYGPNQIFNVVSGLTLGWHTVRIRNASANNGLIVWGVEIINQRTNLAVYTGQGVSQGSSQGLSALTTSAFKAGVVGTRGARVVKYTQNGVLSQIVQEVDATSKYLTNTDHTNEEVLRKINFREFGVNRADDFSTLTSTLTNRAYTLDDGTTGLVALQVRQNTVITAFDSVRIENVAGNFLTLTFVGCGLDLWVVPDSTGTTTNFSLLVDGVSQSFAPVFTNANIQNLKICSGLPYGTHTIKLVQSAASAVPFGILDFVIYQPKKPTIPSGALQVADYNVLADYIANTTAGIDTISTGVLRKTSMRETTYVGTYAVEPIDPSSYINGIIVRSNVSGNYDEFIFFGTGIELRGRANTVFSATLTVSLQASGGSLQTLNSTNFPGLTASSYGGFLYTYASGNLSQAVSNTAGSGFRISGLALGFYKIRITNNTATFFNFDAFDVITPIHINDSSLKIGSQSLDSVTKYSPEKSITNAGPDLSKAKAWVVFDTATNRILKSSNVSAVLAQAGGVYVIYLEKPFKDASYVCVGTIDQPIAGGSAVIFRSWKKNANHTYVETFNTAGANTAGPFTAVFYGELIDE